MYIIIQQDSIVFHVRPNYEVSFVFNLFIFRPRLIKEMPLDNDKTLLECYLNKKKKNLYVESVETFQSAYGS